MDSAETRFTAEIRIEGDMDAVLNKCESDRGSWGPAALEPLEGKGTDICAEIVDIARQQNPAFNFAVVFPDTDEFQQAFNRDEKFDYILFNDIGDTVDVLQAFQNLRPLCWRHTRVLITTYNHLWEPLVTFAERIGMKVPRTEQNWLSVADIR